MAWSKIKHLYPPFWPVLSAIIRHGRADGHCERCGAVNLQPHPITGSKVILTVAHLNHDRGDNRMSNLQALCQRCHFAQHREAVGGAAA